VSPISLVRLGLPCLLAAALLSAPAAAQGNVLLVIADDVGVDRIAAYGAHPEAGPTPVIDALAAHGVLFRTAWSDPLCSPTRAGMLSGRYAFRTGVGDVIVQSPQPNWALQLGEKILPELLAPAASIRSRRFAPPL
jgi:arylsulfatase A-like enzyme